MTPTEPTDEQLDEWDRLAEAATPGPWRWWTSNSFRRLSSDATGKDGDVISGTIQRGDGHPDVCCSDGDKDFIAAAREAVPALIAALRASREECASFRMGFEALFADSGVPWEKELAHLRGEGPDPLPNPRAEAAEAECAKLRGDRDMYHAEAEKLRAKVNDVARANMEGRWVWSDTDDNDIASMGAGMAVTITAGQLRALVTKGAEAAEARVRELEAQRDRALTERKAFDDGDNAGDYTAALPACVRKVRTEFRQCGGVPIMDDQWRYELITWIATAPAASVSRLAMRGDALRIVMEWQRGTVERQDELREQFYDAMIVATVLDADAMVPTLRSMKLNSGDRSPDCPEEKRLWNELSAEWRALVQ